VTLAAFWPVRLNGFIEYDDQDYVTANAQVQRGLSWEGVAWAFQTGHAANWHPFTWLSHMFDVQLFGLNPAGHHLTSVLFHIANATLLFLLLRRTTGALWRSAFVAVLFAVHPLHVESVAWVAERKDVLSTFFGLLAIWAYASYAAKSNVQSLKSKVRTASEAQSSESDVQGSGFEVQGSRFPSVSSGLQLPSWVLYVLSLGLFAFSLMSKSMLVTLPFLLLLLDYWPLGHWQPGSGAGRTARHLLLEKAPFLILSVLSIIATLHVQQAAMSFYRQLPFPLRAGNAVISCARYLGKTLWPEDLAVFYPLPAHWPAWAVVGSALLVTAISVLALVLSRKRPYLPVGWFWFLGLLVPVLGLVQVGVQSMADRYTYLPLVGIFIILAWAGTECLEALHITVRPRIIAAGLLLGLCAALTHSQLQYWRNTEAIFTHAIAVTQARRF
jgi:branched-subunit amino acid transport protein AzlD